MSYLEEVDEIRPLLKGSDHWDEHTLTVRASLREVVAAMMAYQPWWVSWLLKVRWAVAKVLKLKHDESAATALLAPEAVPFSPGEPAGFFSVLDAVEDRYWIAEADDDHHLAAQFSVVAEPQEAGMTRYHLLTLVQYKDWTGPVYFNLIRPFHHLILYCASRWIWRRLRHQGP